MLVLEITVTANGYITYNLLITFHQDFINSPNIMHGNYITVRGGYLIKPTTPVYDTTNA